MPKNVEASIKKSVRKAHPGYSEKQVTSEAFAVMNKQGEVHGNKETAKGRSDEQKYNRDHNIRLHRHQG